MARKSNKTDHVLNLLSSGNKKKGNDGGVKDKSAPPVELKKRTIDESDLEAMESAGPDQELEPDTKETGDTTIPPIEPEAATPLETTEKQSAEPSVAAGAEIPEVSVVQTGGEENPIADAVKDSLEAELDAYLKEEEEGHAASLLEEKENTARGADTEPLPDLPDHGFGSAHGIDPESENELPDLQDDMMNRQQESAVESEHNMDTAGQNTNLRESAGNVEDDLPNHVINTAAEVLNRQEAGTASGHISNQSAEKLMSTGMDTQVGRNETSLNAENAPAKALKEESRREAAAQQLAKEPQQKPEESKQPEPNEEDVDYAIVNVMEHLVRDQVPKYIRQFGHCDCRRCIEDTVALALTHLPPKYVVVNKAAASPLLNFYEKRFAGQLIVEITKASMIIHENPHHKV